MDKIYTPAILKESLSAGWGPITYRQNTELQGAAWHWNPNGIWSDPTHQSGYFIGSTELGQPIRHSARLSPAASWQHQGDGRSRSKYSRITDGDPATYWKSNPYLTSKFTGGVMPSIRNGSSSISGAAEKIDTIRIDWADPYATKICGAVLEQRKRSADERNRRCLARSLESSPTARRSRDAQAFRSDVLGAIYSHLDDPVFNTASTHDPNDPRSSRWICHSMNSTLAHSANDW